MGDMSPCPHGGHVGYCDECSPGWQAELLKASVESDIYEAGIAKGRKELQAELSAAQRALADVKDWAARANDCMDKLEARIESAEREREEAHHFARWIMTLTAGRSHGIAYAILCGKAFDDALAEYPLTSENGSIFLHELSAPTEPSDGALGGTTNVPVGTADGGGR